MTSGEHTIEVRAYDGQAYSDTYTYTHTVASESGNGTEPEPSIIYWAIGVVCIMALLVGVAFWRYRNNS